MYHLLETLYNNKAPVGGAALSGLAAATDDLATPDPIADPLIPLDEVAERIVTITTYLDWTQKSVAIISGIAAISWIIYQYMRDKDK